ncbi:MAG: hypothetical protein RLZZ308_309 [Candidatus Parcubacteria bacterium]|jgi:hypothetical protein
MRFRELFRLAVEHSTTLLFVFGFFTDMILLPDIANPITKYIGLAYVAGIGVLIALREFIVSRNTVSALEQKMYSLCSFGIAYLSGSALSFVFVYALRSAALAVSWPLFVILLLSMFANEFFATHTYRFVLDMMVLFVALVMYVIFNAPVLFGEQSDAVFGISILIASFIAIVYTAFVRLISETSEHEAPRIFALAIGVPMFIGMLYFLNILPAVPLSLSAGHVYHNVARNEMKEYTVLEEMDTRYFASLRRQIHTISDSEQDAFFFSSIEAPAEITAPITHVWEYYDETLKKWTTLATISFTLSGGREDGYRAYSHKEHLLEGLWRVTVKVDAERIVGRKMFYIKKGDTGKLLEKKL